MDGQILAMLSPPVESHTCNQEMPLVKEAGTIYNDRQANMQQGDNKWPQYFFTEQAKGRQNAPAPVLGGVYLIFPAPSADNPGSFPPVTAAAVGHAGAQRHTAVPQQSPGTPAEPHWIHPHESNPGISSPSLSPSPSPCELFRTICKFSFFHASTLSVRRIKDTATPHKFSLQSIFCILSITHEHVSP